MLNKLHCFVKDELNYSKQKNISNHKMKATSKKEENQQTKML